MLGVRVNELHVNEIVEGGHFLAEVGGDVGLQGRVHLGDDLLAARDHVVALLVILLFEGDARLFAEAQRAVVEHELELLGGGGEDLGAEVVLCALWIHTLTLAASRREPCYCKRYRQAEARTLRRDAGIAGEAQELRGANGSGECRRAGWNTRHGNLIVWIWPREACWL